MIVVVLGVKTYRDNELGEWSVWIAIAALCYFGMLCFFAACSIPSKEASKRLAAQKIRSD
jgi:hypothetical protein